MAGNTRRSAEGGAGPGVREERVGSPDSRQSWWQVWAPLLARAAAIGLALLGLAGIGLAAARSESSTQLVRAPFSVGLAQLVGGDLPRTLAASPPPRAQPALDAGVAPPLEPALALPPARPARLPCAPAPAPAAERNEAQPVAPASSPPAVTGHALTADGRIILNRAGLAELQRLPGIGAKRAEAILALRARLGRFRRASDLLRIKGIGPRLLERILPQVVLDE